MRKQPGRKFGPSPKNAPTPGHAEPMQGGRRLTHYSRQRGKEWIRPTPRQLRRIEKKWRRAAKRGMPWAFEHLAPGARFFGGPGLSETVDVP